jgi:hypothetical protein
MSGGSYDYLFAQESSDLLAHEGNLEAMSARLAGLGYAQDAARETEELLVIIRQVRVRLQVRMDRVKGVWRAIEWWDSADSGEDAVRDALARYRESGAL